MAARVLFVCLGNICRSPLAEAAFRNQAAKAGLTVEVDSAGTSNYHIGEPPDPRSITEARRHGIDISGSRVRQLTRDDFRHFDWIVGMDRDNMAAIERLAPARSRAATRLMLDFVDGRAGEDVVDPWHGSAADFRTTWDDVSAGAAALVQLLKQGCSGTESNAV